jgi:hypothetical protein
MQPIIAHCHSGLAVVHTLLGDAGTAETHRAHARRICQTIGMTPPPTLTSADASISSL